MAERLPLLDGGNPPAHGRHDLWRGLSVRLLVGPGEPEDPGLLAHGATSAPWGQTGQIGLNRHHMQSASGLGLNRSWRTASRSSRMVPSAQSSYSPVPIRSGFTDRCL